MFRLNPALDVAMLAQSYRTKGRLQVREILEEDCAERVHAILTQETPWGIAFNEGDHVYQLRAEEVRSLTAQQAQQIMVGVHQRAQSSYQFFYNYYPLLEDYFRPGGARGPLFDFYEFINSEPVLEFLRTLTGLSDIRWADAHATQFRAGNFLKYHTDENPNEGRLAAYVFNFTKGWGRDWGGFLQFFNDRYDVEEAYRPVFNAINVFTVPADHSVGIVAPFAPGGRYSVTGWLRGDAPPAPIGGRSQA